MKKTLFVLAVFVVAVVSGLLISMVSVGPKAKETFAQKQTGMPLGGSGMGPYDGVSLPGVAAGWLATDNVPTGSAPVDSSASPSMLLAKNKTSPSCCPSSITTDTGCLCLSQADKSLFASRGGNRALA